MTPKQYADKLYPHLPSYNKIASDGFKAGLENAKPQNIVKLEQELKSVKKELDSLWKTLEDPEKCGELLSGM